MKRKIAFIAAVVCMMALLAGCGNNDDMNMDTAETTTQNNGTQDSTQSQEETATQNTENNSDNAPGTYSYKIGIGVISRMDNSRDAGDSTGLARIDSTVAAVVVDDGGVIVDCHLDGMKHQIEFNNEGKVTTPLDTTLKTKNELGDDYGMKAASDIGKEWYEQAEAFENYVTGMTVEDVLNIPTDDDGMMTDADAVASVTIAVSDFQQAIQKAVDNAR